MAEATEIRVDGQPPLVVVPPTAPEAVTDAPGGTLAPLRLPPFRRLALGYVVNELGNWLGDIALVVLVFDRTGSALATAGLFVGTRFIPALLGPGLTARVEHLDSRRLLPALYVLEALTFCGLAVLDWRFSLALVVLLATVDGALALTAKAVTRAATVAVLAPTGELRRGNALLNMGFTGAGAAGPVLAGVVVALLSPGVALLLDAVTFVAVAALLSRLPRGAITEGVAAEPWSDRFRAGLSYAARRPAVRWLLLGEAAALLFFTLVVPVEVVFAKQTLHAGSGGYGALLTSWGVGMVVGGVMFTRAGRIPLFGLLAGSALLIGGGYLAMGLAPTLAWACAGASLGGIGNGIGWVGLVTAIQSAVEPAFQARIMALFEGLGSLVPGIGFVLGGVIAQLASPRAAFVVAGFGVVAVVLVGSVLALALARRDPVGQAAASAPNASSTGT